MQTKNMLSFLYSEIQLKPFQTIWSACILHDVTTFIVV